MTLKKSLPPMGGDVEMGDDGCVKLKKEVRVYTHSDMTKALKQQREICADVYVDEQVEPQDSVKFKILTADEPDM